MSEDFVNAPEANETLQGWSRLAENDLAGAKVAFDRAHAVFPRSPEPLTGLAQIAARRGDWPRAAGCAGVAVRLGGSSSQQAAAHAVLGRALYHLDHAEPARAALHVAIIHDPTHVQAHADLAEVLIRMTRIDDAIAALDIAIRNSRSNAALRMRRADLLGQIGRADDAVADFRAIAILHPDDPAALANLGAGLLATGALDAAADALSQSTPSGTPTPETLNNIGLVAMARGDLRQAKAALAAAYDAAPDDPRIVNNFGTIQQELGDLDGAEALFGAVIAAGDGVESMRAAFNLGTLLLGRGQWAAGWPLFEQRRPLLAQKAAPLPPWDGQQGTARVMIVAEQGLGDIIQFARFLRDAAARAPLAVRLPEAASGLLEMMPALKAFPSGHIVTNDAPCAAYCPLLSLPRLLGLSAPANVPYLEAASLVSGLRPVVGIVWRGSARYRFDRRRSIDFDRLAPLLAVPGIVWRNLQRDTDVPGFETVDLSTLAATARAIMGCDLVIAVDTAIAHLAGALGRPVWLFNRFGGDWRWYDAPHEDEVGPSAWYSDVTQFQPTAPTPPPACWDGPIAAMTAALHGRFSL